MKVLTIILALVSTQAFAFNNDFECKFDGLDNEQVLVEVERSPYGGSKRIDVTVTSEDSVERYNYFTTARINSMNRLEYFGAGMDLEIDLWPDRRPRYGRFYNGEFRSFDVNNGHRFYNIRCQYIGF